MRPIKFRAWDRNKKQWFKAPEPFESALGSYLMTFDGRVYVNGMLTNVELLQFTGLLDKNGKEIYEGDIVVKNGYIWFDDGTPNYRGTVECIYSQWQVIAHCVNPNKRGISDGINEGLNDEGIEDGEKSKWEVIGNIHETPDLLKKD